MTALDCLVASVSTGPARVPVLIACSETAVRRVMRVMLARYTDFEVTCEACTCAEAITAILTHRPALAFLDARMRDGTGLDVVHAIGIERMPVVVISAPDDTQAMQAFEARALDYLLAPWDRDRFDGAIARVRHELRRRSVDDRLLAFLDHVDAPARYLQRITVRSGTRALFVPVASVDSFEADANYVWLRVGTQAHLIRDTLSGLAMQLDPARFLRVHRSVIVQLSRVVQVDSRFSGEFVLTLTNGRRLTSGRTYRSVVQTAFGL